MASVPGVRYKTTIASRLGSQQKQAAIMLFPALLAMAMATLSVGQASLPVKPEPCVPSVPPPNEEETAKRFADFAQAFIYDQNITKAFEYIAKGYINHNPQAQNGSDAAWAILSPIWSNVTITPLRTTFKSPQGWLNYETDGFGTVVDRYRWSGGCIVEHWDQGEVYPADDVAACS